MRGLTGGDASEFCRATGTIAAMISPDLKVALKMGRELLEYGVKELSNQPRPFTVLLNTLNRYEVFKIFRTSAELNYEEIGRQFDVSGQTISNWHTEYESMKEKDLKIWFQNVEDFLESLE